MLIVHSNMSTIKITDNLNSLKPKENNNSMERLNEKLVGVLDELSSILMRQGEPFRAKAYREASDVIVRIEKDITDVEELHGMSRIGSTIYNKLTEFINTGTLQVLEKERNNPLNLLTKVYGIGPKKAKEFINNGWTTLDDLRANPGSLTTAMKYGLIYFDDIESRIPRSEIQEYEMILGKYFTPLNNNDKFEIVGSYRRGNADSGDIDIIITGDTDKVFKEFIDSLIESKLIVAILSRGKIKCLAISQLPGRKARRIDFMYSPLDEYAFAILYFTGSKIFNTIQRQRALDLGLTLNEHGFHKMSNCSKGEKLMKHFPTEESIFSRLGMEYIEPSQRIDSRSAKYIKKELKEPEPEIRKKTMPKNVSKKQLKVLPPRKTQKNSVIKSPSRNIKIFKSEGIEALKMLDENELASMIQIANDAYYENNTSLLTDNQYDILREYTLQQYPNNSSAISGHTQCEVQKNKSTLPYEMGSMDKIKPDTQALSKWLETYDGPYVISCKLDGISGLYTTEGDKPKLYTRGNGLVGQDISHLIPYLDLPSVKGVVIRGEFIIEKVLFEQKYASRFANPRNFVAGVINQKKIDTEKYQDIDFVAYELIKPETNPSLQLKALENLDICVVEHIVGLKSISNEMLSKYLIDWRSDHIYEIDGVICCNDKIYPRKSGNPDHALAFKMVLSDQVAEAKVVNVEWNPSKDGYLKPRVQIEPIRIGGAKIEHATGFNGGFIYNNKIGVGSLIKIIRSGDVIPHILEVIEPAEEPLMPCAPYSWTKGNVDIILDNKKDDTVVREKIITAFFKNIGVEGLGPGNIRKMIQSGYNSVPKILFMDEKEYLNIDGFGSKLAKKIYNGICEKIKNATLHEIMTASHVFGRGFGNKKFIVILEAYPDILVSNLNSETKIFHLTKLNGMSDKTAAAFVKEIPYFIEWMKTANIQDKLVFQKKKIHGDPIGPLYQKNIVTTGIGNKPRNILAEKLEKVGGNLEKNVNKDTFVVLVVDMDEDTDKANKARSLNIPIMLIDDFVTKYNL